MGAQVVQDQQGIRLAAAQRGQRHLPGQAAKADASALMPASISMEANETSDTEPDALTL